MRKTPNAELDRLNVEEFKQAEKTPLVLVLDNVRSANNVGSAFRTGDAFLVEAIYLCGITAQPPHRDITKTALGATESVHWQHHKSTVDAITALKAEGYTIAAVEQADDSIALQDFTPTSKLALVFGHEVSGVSQEVMELVDHCIEIPQFGTKHSLNISVSVGVVVWEVFKRVGLK